MSCFLPAFSRSPASDADGSLSGFRQVDCPLRLRMDEALPSYREDDGDWCDHGALTSHVLQAGGPLSFFHLHNDCEPAPEFFWIVRSAGLPALP